MSEKEEKIESNLDEEILISSVFHMIIVPREVIQRKDIVRDDVVYIKGFIIGKFKSIFQKFIEENVVVEGSFRVSNFEFILELQKNESLRNYPLFCSAKVQVISYGITLKDSIWSVEEMSIIKNTDEFLDKASDIKNTVIDDDAITIYKEGFKL